MAFIIHTGAETKFNKDAYDLVDLLEESEIKEETEISVSRSGSGGEKIVKDWTDKLVDAPMVISHTTNGEKKDIYENYNGVQTGFNEINYRAFKKFLTGLYKIKSVSDKITYNFLYDLAFKWIIETFKNKKAETDFITYLKEKTLKVTGEYKYYFKVLNLDIEKKFQLGDITFEYLDAAHFDKLNGIRPDDEIQSLREKFQGSVYLTCILKDIQKDRGVEVALHECYKAMNVLKLFSDTVRVPTHKTTYDIDRRVTVSEEHEYIVENVNLINDFKVNLSAGATPYQLNKEKIDAIVILSRNYVSLIMQKEPNELQRLLLNALEKYSEAISNKDIHRRIVDLFTIWESLLLKNDSVNIQDSLIFFGNVFINVPAEDKDFFNSLIMSMYDLRSQMVHHANRKELDMEKIALLQRDTATIIETFINQSSRISIKYLLLDEAEKFLGMTIEEYTAKRKKGD